MSHEVSDLIDMALYSKPEPTKMLDSLATWMEHHAVEHNAMLVAKTSAMRCIRCLDRIHLGTLYWQAKYTDRSGQRKGPLHSTGCSGEERIAHFQKHK